MSFWSPDLLYRYASFCIPVTWSDTKPREYEIFDIDEEGHPVLLDVPWNKKRDMILTKLYIMKYARDAGYGNAGIKAWFRTLYKHKEYLKTCKRK